MVEPPLPKHSTKRAPARANGKADRACRGRSQAPGAGESIPEINSPATAAASMKLPGNASAKLPGKGNQPFRIIPNSSRSEVDPIRNKSPTHRQNILQPNRLQDVVRDHCREVSDRFGAQTGRPTRSERACGPSRGFRLVTRGRAGVVQQELVAAHQS